MFKLPGRHAEEGTRRKKGYGIMGLVRTMLSLVILSVLGIMMYQAFRSFSGVDPMNLNPKAVIKSFATSESAYEIVNAFFTLGPRSSLERIKQILQEGGNVSDIVEQAAGAPEGEKNVAFSFAIVADSHKDTQMLNRALIQAKESNAKFVVGIGDFSDVGTIEELRDTKLPFDTIGLPYYVTPGDHDCWDSKNKGFECATNFQQVFGNPYQSISYGNARIILFNNADNNFGVDSFQMKWIEDELDRASAEEGSIIFAVASIPLFHPSSDHVMGKVDPKLKDQAEHLSSVLKKKGVDEVFFGDTHMHSRYTEPKNDLKMTVVGAVTSTKNPQAPRFVMVDIYEGGGYNVRDVEIK